MIVHAQRLDSINENKTSSVARVLKIANNFGFLLSADPKLKFCLSFVSKLYIDCIICRYLPLQVFPLLLKKNKSCNSVVRSPVIQNKEDSLPLPRSKNYFKLKYESQ